MASATESSKTSKKDLGDDLQKAKEDYIKKIQEDQKAIADLDKNYQKDQLKASQEHLKDSLTTAQQMQAKQDEINALKAQLPSANNNIAAANMYFSSVVNQHSAAAQQLACILKIRKDVSDSNNFLKVRQAGSQGFLNQDALQCETDQKGAAATAEAQALITVSDAKAKVQAINDQITSAQTQLTQLQSATTQTTQLDQTEMKASAASYIQERNNDSQNLQQDTQIGNQKVMMLQSELQAATSDKGDAKVSADAHQLIAHKCCSDDAGDGTTKCPAVSDNDLDPNDPQAAQTNAAIQQSMQMLLSGSLGSNPRNPAGSMMSPTMMMPPMMPGASQ